MLKNKPPAQCRWKSVLICGLMLLLVGGCAAKPLGLSLNPTENMEVKVSQKQAQGSIGVVPFVDERPVRHGSDNTKWRGLIPGMLWIEISSDIPETYTAFSHYESKPLDRASSRAVVDILKRSGLFTEVIDLQKQPKASPQYRLNGVVYRTLVNETGYYYGSSIYAWLVRVLGLPYVSFNVEYHLGLSLTAVDSGNVLWQTEIRGAREDKFYSVYGVSRGRDGKHVIAWNLADILAEEFSQHVDELEAVLAEKGESYDANGLKFFVR